LGWVSTSPLLFILSSDVPCLPCTGGDPLLSGLSDKVTDAYRTWFEWIVMKVRMVMGPGRGREYEVVCADSLVGLFSVLLVRKEVLHGGGGVRDKAIAQVKRGMGGRFGNKVSSFLLFRATFICRFPLLTHLMVLGRHSCPSHNRRHIYLLH
jgi:hypothetical protein